RVRKTADREDGSRGQARGAESRGLRLSGPAKALGAIPRPRGRRRRPRDDLSRHRPKGPAAPPDRSADPQERTAGGDDDQAARRGGAWNSSPPGVDLALGAHARAATAAALPRAAWPLAAGATNR